MYLNEKCINPKGPLSVAARILSNSTVDLRSFGDCKTDWLWVLSPLEEMKYLLKFIFPFLRSGVEAKRGVEFCH